MREAIIHGLGLCGEGHPSLITLLTVSIGPILVIGKLIKDYVKTFFIN